MSSRVSYLKNVPFVHLLTPTLIFMMSTMVVNGGNYVYNLALGRLLSPARFSEAGLMVTLLLVASFVAMTFQIVATKFTVELDSHEEQSFLAWFERLSLKFGAVVSVVILLFHERIAVFFHLTSSWSVVLFALTMPVFFLMSVGRGRLQGAERFIALSGSYQSEMWGRVAITFILLYLVGWSIDLQISLAVFVSVLLAYMAIPGGMRLTSAAARFGNKQQVYLFVALTAGYEGAQILINYTDILLVKHYFSESEAGLYTSMALIGRMIYFMTWMVVMILIPKVLRLRKEGGAYQRALIQYFGVITIFSSVLILGAYTFSEEIVLVLFGEAYVSIAHLLWQYGLATMLFALANVLVYYFLSLDQRLPVYVAIGFGVVQVVLFSTFHQTLGQMVMVQIINMSVLLGFMIGYFFWKRL